MTVAVQNRKTGEELLVLLEIGDDLWLRNDRGETERARRQHFPLERWCFIGEHPAVDDVPVPLLARHTCGQLATGAFQ